MSVRLCSWRTARPAISARLTLHDQRVLVKDVHDHRDGLLTTRADQASLMNLVHESTLASRTLYASAFRRDPDMMTASAAETEVDRTAPTHRRHDDAIVSAALSTGQTGTSLGFFVELRTIRHGELAGEYTDNSVLPKRFCSGMQ